MDIANQPKGSSADAGDSLRSVSAPSMTAKRGLLFALGYAPLVTLFAINLWGRPHYQFFPLALVGAGFLAWTRLKDAASPFEPGRPLLTKLLLTASFLCLAAATVLWSPWLAVIATWIGLAGMIWWKGGKPLFRAMLPALLLVLTIIPPPLSADIRLIQYLRVLAVTFSSRLLDVLCVTHALSGNVIELPGKQLLVDEACSGINSALITLVGCLFYGMWRRRSAVHISFCLINTLAFVLLGNLTRITLGAWLRFRYNIDILSGRSHELTGLLLFVSYFIMILSMDQLLAFLVSPIRPPQTPTKSPAATKAPALRSAPGQISRSWARAAGYAFAMLGLVELGLGWINYQHSRIQAASPKSILRAGATLAMPEQIGQWKRLNTEVPPLQKVETMGVFSQVWHYQRGNTLASLALDYPFRGYHDVTACYRSRGWDLLDRRLRGGGSTNASPLFAEVKLQNHMGLYGALWFSAVDERGRWLPGAELSPGLKARFLGRFKVGSPEESVTYQIQVLSTGFNPLKSFEQEQVRQFYQEASMTLWHRLLEQLQRKE
jgi:exosortase